MIDMLLINNINISEMVLTGFYTGVLVTFSIGFLGYGLNYALKLFKA